MKSHKDYIVNTGNEWKYTEKRPSGWHYMRRKQREWQYPEEKNNGSQKMIIGIWVFVVLLLSFAVWFLFSIWRKVPSNIYLRAGNTEEFDFSVPATANIENSTLDFARPVTLYAEKQDNYTMQVKLFGLFDFKKMHVNVIENTKLYPVGIPIGIYVKTKGILVLQSGEFVCEDGKVAAPAQALKKGDYILSVNGTEVQSKLKLISMVEESEGLPMSLEVKRGTQQLLIDVVPQKNKEGDYKLGIWIRDNAQGVGTLTYVDESGHFGALGHGINDIDTCELMEMEYGRLYDTDIIAIQRGEQGYPGEMTGFIAYEKEKQLGEIERNSTNGIYGTVSDIFLNREDIKQTMENDSLLLPIGLKQDVKLGNAFIFCTVDDAPKQYEILITEIHSKTEKSGRSMKLEVIDEELLKKTGGIIQGMSGSPIIQNGKIIGAVTHVLVNDPTKGYGIFIQEML